ncbi:MAG: hypothetical protein OEM96_10115 [Gemmatimonadota bacterium]|nr:hypothetical protein [Gemmatimonadota bacterium]
MSLTWTFSFDYAPVRRSHGETVPGLVFDWVRLGRCSWTTIAGQQATAHRFGEPIETSAYFFEHYRYEEAEIRILEQRGWEIFVAAGARGDIDGLGIDPLQADEWLLFGGIFVQPNLPPLNAGEAKRLLAGFTDTTALVGVPREHNYLFKPAG